ncbi:glycosyl hydrolase family 30 [Paucilactobacillus hokkaidonensis JCM 18461]|uniref:Glycosyl hydrolase family 30 n=2 Tax=Paucilactobacillus hokkaidonensis TaxID=1193095 RepID=A0A0A1GWH7_9LACO|nr:glycoside hydrolase family 30 beta sandwich domain-containing protein [Paucilactobacillus hokkaidonensis]KRO08865.1 O-glycosyl hydrolase [Paucilactobacillus hokkaidonensis]BAP86602.1 glycosyl hydrolase family 30 [Paucilactobacillus hokkaidonensis JCM 18461]
MQITNENDSLNEFWTSTSGDLSQKREQVDIPKYQRTTGNASEIIIDPSVKKQDWLGAGAAITDSAASLIWDVLDKKQRSSLLQELFDPAQGGFSSIRVPLGSCDFQSQDYYTYDDVPFGEHDNKLEKFSIGTGTPGRPDATKDLKHIVPVIQEILKINPAVKIIASPWSSPAWMKNSGHLTFGGHLRFGEYTGNGFTEENRFEYIYAQYFVRYIEEYRKLGIPIYGVTIQNEPSNAAHWPAMIWTLPQLASFGYKYLRPALNHSFPDTKMYILDDSFHALDKPITEEVTRDQATAFDGMAVHTYTGPYDNLYNANRAFPNWSLIMTERRCMMEETPENAAHIMFGIIGNWLVRNGLNMITLWNLALDERGLPNAADSTGRRGVVTIDHATGKIKRNLEYYMLRNFGQDVTVGSKVIGSSNYTIDGYTGGLGSVAFQAPDGSISAHIYNPTGQPLNAAITINGLGSTWQVVTVPAWGTVTLHKSTAKLNTSSIPKDDEFKLNPTPANRSDFAPGENK